MIGSICIELLLFVGWGFDPGVGGEGRLVFIRASSLPA